MRSVLCRNRPGGARAKVFHQGTFTGNPATAKAALVTIQEVVETNLCDHAGKMADSARSELNRLFKRMGVPWRAYGRFSAFHIFPEVPGDTEAQLEKLPWQQFAKRSRDSCSICELRSISKGGHWVQGSRILLRVHETEDTDYLVAAFERTSPVASTWNREVVESLLQ